MGKGMKSAREIEGPWVEPGVMTGLIERCKPAWDIPIDRLTDAQLATFLRQKIALPEVIQEAEMRMRESRYDDTELYDGELRANLMAAQQGGAPPDPSGTGDL
jgi:hypothetical protein